MEKAKESVVVAWCDNGNTDSLFTSSIASLLLNLNGQHSEISAVGINQTIGNQIARQRQDALRNFEQMDCDWLLWVDSDIVITLEAFDLVWKTRNPETHPVVCGVYFITYEMNQTLPAPLPCIFKINDEGKNQPIHPLPQNEVVPIDIAGLGFCLMHKSVAKKLREAYEETTFQIQIDTDHISEDVSFFSKLKELGIPVHAHTGATVQHIKRFSLDQNYYNFWWNAVAPIKMKEQEEKDKIRLKTESKVENLVEKKKEKKPQTVKIKKVRANKKNIKKIESSPDKVKR